MKNPRRIYQNAKPGARRRRRSAAKKGRTEKSKSNTISKHLQVEDAEVVQETSHSEVESSEKYSAPSISRSRRKKTTAVDPPTESKVTTEDASVDFRNLKSSTTEGILSSSSAISEDEHMHRLGFQKSNPLRAATP